MFRNENLEMKVGLFIGIGIFLAFVLVFSISDMYMLKDGYTVKVQFDYVNGITENSPVRLAGVHVGEISTIKLVHDGDGAFTKVKVEAMIREGVRIEKDAVAGINTLGLLGEQYLEISPGKSSQYLADGDDLRGINPVNVGQQMQVMSSMLETAREIGEKMIRGEGTLARLLTDGSVYNELSSILNKINTGEGTMGRLINDGALYKDLDRVIGGMAEGRGTVGKLLTEDEIYNDLRFFVKDIKEHPWKLLRRDVKKRDDDRSRRSGTVITPL
jgi:phospholipid/cholesterol/gamma-HCH transport system substrate-binding protein